MRVKIKYLSVAVIIVAVLSISLPVLEGFYARHIIMREVSKLRDLADAQINTSPNFQIHFDITAYRQGIYSSDAEFVVNVISTDTKTGKVTTDTYRSIERIKHGPLLTFKNHWQFGTALIVNKITKAQLSKIDTTQLPDTLASVSALLSLSGSRWDIFIQAAPLHVTNNTKTSKVDWDGLTGELVWVTRADKLVKTENEIIFGKLAVIDNTNVGVETAPIKININAALNSKQFMESKLSIMSDKIRVYPTYPGKAINASNIKLDTSSHSTKETYNYNGDVTINKISFPENSGLNNISNMRYHGEVNHLSLNGYQQLTAVENKIMQMKPDEVSKVGAALDLMNAYFKLLTANTNVVYQFTSDTNLGKATVDLKMWLNKLPDNYFDLLSQLRLQAMVRAAVPLVQHVEQYDDQIKPTIEKMAAAQLLQQNNNEYVLNFGYQQSAITINNREFKDFSSLDKYLTQAFNK